MVKVTVNGNKKETNVVLVAIIVIAILEAIALFNGINGQLLRWSIATIVGLACLMIPNPDLKKILEVIQNVRRIK